MEISYFDLDIDYSRVSDKHLLIGLLHRFDNRYQAVADEFFKELSWTQLFCIKGISLFKYAPTIRDMADFLGCSHQNAAQLLRKLCKEGYVKLETDECDRRKQRLYLTEKAEAFLGEHAKVTGKAMDDIFGVLTENDMLTVMRALRKLDDSLKKYEYSQGNSAQF